MRSVVAVAMSGGVDSSMAAALLVDEGWDVFGISGLFASAPVPGAKTGSQRGAETAALMARKVADKIGIPHHVVDLRNEFEREIIAYFVAGYTQGKTPSPCGLCNSRMKFGLLMKAALDMGGDRFATGHYARLAYDDAGNVHLRRAVDAKKDQSYFLFKLNQAQLRQTLFPLGEMTKTAVRAGAEQRDLPSRKSKESLDLCFVGDMDHGSWIASRLSEAPAAGDIVDMDRHILGRHRGIQYCTVGQRRGLGIARGKPMYVVSIDAARNRVVVGDHKAACRREMNVNEANWISGHPPDSRFVARVQIRYNHAGAPAQLNVSDDGTVHVEFETPQFAVTPGQIAAFYVGEEILGGGWIV